MGKVVRKRVFWGSSQQRVQIYLNKQYSFASRLQKNIWLVIDCRENEHKNNLNEFKQVIGLKTPKEYQTLYFLKNSS